jgi:hypothetical protein
VSGSWGLAARYDDKLCYVGGYAISESHWSAGQRTRRCAFCPNFTASFYCDCFAFHSLPRPHSENEDLRRTAVKIPELEDEVDRLGAQVCPPYCPDLLRYSLNFWWEIRSSIGANACSDSSNHLTSTALSGRQQLCDWVRAVANFHGPINGRLWRFKSYHLTSAALWDRQ